MEKESEIAKEVVGLTNTIISTGGGVVVRKENVDALKKNGVVVLLNADIETLLKRIGDDKARPFLTDAKTRKEEITEVLRQREKLYKNAADIVIDTDKLSSKQVAEKIVSGIKDWLNSIKNN